MIASHLADLAQQSVIRGIYTYSDFLPIQDAALAGQAAGGTPYLAWGGMEGCERVMIRFGDASQLGYEEPFPISIIRVSPKNSKFSDDLTHRDFLGALMHLGIERSTIGDILIRENTAWIFALEQISEFIARELTGVKHTSVMCSIVDELPEDAAPKKEQVRVNIPSLRLDAVIAALYHLSRGKTKELFSGRLVFVNGDICMNESFRMKEGDSITVRGYGRFVFNGESGQTRKGRVVAELIVFR